MKTENKEEKIVWEEDFKSLSLRLIPILVTVVAIVGGLWLSTYIIGRQIGPEKYASVKSAFFQRVERHLALGISVSAQDMEMVRTGVAREKESERLKSDDLAGLLMEFLASIDTEKGIDVKKQAERAETVKTIISKIMSEKPFSILSEEDQLTAIELQNSIELGDKDTAISRLHLLANSLGKEVLSLNRRLDSSWRWTIYSVLIGAVGILATTIYFVLSRGSRYPLSMIMRQILDRLEVIRREIGHTRRRP